MTGPLLQSAYGQALRLCAQVAEFHRPRLAAKFGPRAALEWCRGEWKAGYKTECGLHVRGTSPDDPAAAVDSAIKNALNCDPTPEFPDLAPEGYYLKGAQCSS